MIGRQNCARLLNENDYFLSPLSICCGSACCVLLACAFSVSFVPLCVRYPFQRSPGTLGALGMWDGRWYDIIARDGYQFTPGIQSSVAFFPLFPMSGRALAVASGCSTLAALALISNACFLASALLLSKYAGLNTLSTQSRNSQSHCATACLCAWPGGLFFRLAYSESLLLLLLLVAMYGIKARWPIVAIAVIIGVATSCRLVALAAVPALVLHICNIKDTTFSALVTLSYALPLSVFGICGFALYCYFAFDDPLAFAHAQSSWTKVSVTTQDNVTGLATLQAFAMPYDSQGVCAWQMITPQETMHLNMRCLGPVYIAITIALILVGGHFKWLSAHEILLSAGLIAIPVFTQATRTCMASQMRYMSVVFPAYIVLGRLLATAPFGLQVSGYMLGTLFLVFYGILYSAGYAMY